DQESVAAGLIYDMNGMIQLEIVVRLADAIRRRRIGRTDDARSRERDALVDADGRINGRRLSVHRGDDKDAERGESKRIQGARHHWRALSWSVDQGLMPVDKRAVTGEDRRHPRALLSPSAKANTRVQGGLFQGRRIMRVTYSDDFACPPDRLWRFIEEPELQKQWMKGL